MKGRLRRIDWVVTVLLIAVLVLWGKIMLLVWGDAMKRKPGEPLGMGAHSWRCQCITCVPHKPRCRCRRCRPVLEGIADG